MYTNHQLKSENINEIELRCESGGKNGKALNFSPQLRFSAEMRFFFAIDPSRAEWSGR
jgi:hypothetical protein